MDGAIITNGTLESASGTDASAVRERGWRRILPALVLFLLVPAVPELRVIFPLEQTFLLVGPAIAACTVVAWRSGGRGWLGAVWVGLSIWMIAQPLSGSGGYDYLARGWAVLLAAAFGVMCLANARSRFFTRALAALAVAVAVAGAVVFASPVSTGRVQRVVADEIDRRVVASSADFAATWNSPEWQKFAQEHPSAAAFLHDAERQWRQIPDVTTVLFPSLLALESLAALGLAWGLFHRVSRTRVGPPLGRLREFRFSDELVWGLAAGIAIAVIPALEGLRAVGYNLMTFFGALYLMRGAAVIAWFLEPRRLASTVMVVVAIVFWWLLGPVALGLGIFDTWIDWRGRLRQVT